VAGSVASGKSTVSKMLSRSLRDAPILTFDHYEDNVQWPENMEQWVQDGYNPRDIKVPKLKNDLLLLLAGETINFPFTNNFIFPAKYIIIEEPSGREREEIRDLIDLVVFIDTPQDICVLRMILREIDLDEWSAKKSSENISSDFLKQQLTSVVNWTDQYKRARNMYIGVSNLVKMNADIVVDGMLPDTDIISNIKNNMN